MSKDFNFGNKMRTDQDFRDYIEKLWIEYISGPGITKQEIMDELFKEALIESMVDDRLYKYMMNAWAEWEGETSEKAIACLQRKKQIRTIIYRLIGKK